MATYKVIQDVEAEDKLVGPLTLWQFIYALIAAFCMYLGFLAVTKDLGVLLVVLMPFILFFGFLAVPWGGDQPTEIWALAKLRFYLKPRKRIWDQSGAHDLVTVNAPKHVERHLTNGLNQSEVHNRLNALASTIDSRGWAVKNVNVNLSANPAIATDVSDRLVAPASLPQEVVSVDVTAADDIMDERANPIAQQFDSLINQAATQHRQALISQMQQPTPPPPPPPTPQQTQASQGQPQGQPVDYWFMHQTTPVAGQATFVDAPVVAPGITTGQPLAAPQAALPTPEEQAMVERFKRENNSQTIAYNHLKTLRTPEQIAEDDRRAAAEAARQAAEASAEAARKAQVTSEKQAAIINLANNDDLDIATLQRQARKEVQNDDGEVVISLR